MLRSTLILLALMFALPAAYADGDPATDAVPRIFPYQGVLELDGRPVNASGDNALHIRFLLFNGVDAEAHVYRQDLQIDVYNGRFTATIGPVGTDAAGAQVPIERVIAAADDLYLGMVLLGDPANPDDDVALSNRQRLHASPYAMWTTRATDLTVARDTIVGRNLTVTGAANVQGALTVQGPVNLSNGAINTNEIADGAIRATKVALGPGLSGRGAAPQTLGIDEPYIDGRIERWVRAHCKIELGHRDRCENCNRPRRSTRVKANRTCESGCRNNNDGWGAVRLDGNVDGNDSLFIRFTCTDTPED